MSETWSVGREVDAIADAPARFRPPKLVLTYEYKDEAAAAKALSASLNIECEDAMAYKVRRGDKWHVVILGAVGVFRRGLSEDLREQLDRANVGGVRVDTPL